MEKSGITQSYTRVYNNSLLLKELRKKPESATNLSKILNLSNAAVSSIIKELLQKNIIVVSKTESVAKNGRKQVFYKPNDNFGLIIVISLSGKVARSVVSNLNEESLIDTSMDIEKYDIKTIYEIILDLKIKIEESIYNSIPVKSVVISVPGRVNKRTGELQFSKQYDEELLKQNDTFINLFKKYFFCDVFVFNDIYLAALCEESHGSLKDAENGLLVYVDEGIGSSFIFNSKQYRGELGYAGEIGLMRTIYDGKEGYLDDFVSLRAIKEKLNIKRTSELTSLYFTNEQVKKTVNESAQVLGKLLCDIQELLNFKTIVISGRATNFKEEYLNIVKSEMDHAFSKCEVMYSQNESELCIKGGIELAVKKLTNVYSEVCNKEKK